MGRPAQIDTAALLAAGLQLVDEQGLAALTMQSVADRLGVTPMALYRHVKNKADLLDGVVESILLEVPLPDPNDPWPDRLAAMPRGTRIAAVRHPGVFPLLLQRAAAIRVPAALGTPSTRRCAGLGCPKATWCSWSGSSPRPFSASRRARPVVVSPPTRLSSSMPTSPGSRKYWSAPFWVPWRRQHREALRCPMEHFHQVTDELRAPYRALTEAIPDVMAGYRALQTAAMADGSLSASTKELIALAVAITRECDGCISAHARGAARRGATASEVTEMIGVAISMNGGPGTVWGPRALAAFQEFADPA